MKLIFSLLLSLTLASHGATYWLLDKNTDGVGSKPKVTSVNSTVFGVNSSGVLELLPQSTFATAAALALKAPLDSPSFTGGITSAGAISISGTSSNIRTTGANGNISTAGPNASIFTEGANAFIATYGSDADIIAMGGGDIQTVSGQFIGAGTGLTGTAAGLTSGTVTTINGRISAGSNITITGDGTGASPYTIASGGATRYSGTGTTALTTSQSGSMIVNAGGSRTFTLPAGAAGLIYSFKCETSSTLTIKTGTTELIKHGTLTTAATTGVLTSSTIGSIITVAWDGTYWQTTAATHNWAVDGVTLTDLPAGNLAGDIAVARIATALTAPGPIGGTTAAAISGTTGTFSAIITTGSPPAATTGQTNYGNGVVRSSGNFIVDLDDDSNESAFFYVRDGGNAVRFSVSEAGAADIAGTLSVTGASTTAKVTSTGDHVITDSAKGFVLKDTQGTPHYWRITVSNLGALSTADLGTTAP